MRRQRDRIVAAGAVLVVAAIALLIVLTVRSAERHGLDALEALQSEQVDQLAQSMGKRLDGFTGVATGLRRTPFTLEPANPADLQILTQLSLDPNARTGLVLVDSSGTVVNGVLLGDLELGTSIDLPDVASAIAAPGFTFFPVQPGLTSSEPTLPIVFPLEGARGAVVAESAVVVDSAFNTEVAELSRGDTGDFFFLDPAGSVLASSDPTLLGQVLPGAGALLGRADLTRAHGEVVATAPVPGVGWTAVFRQDADEFEGGLTDSIQSAQLLIVVGTVLGGGVLFSMLLGRLRAAHEEQRRLADIHAAWEEFISIVSHELRTPVAGVLGFLETSLDHWADMTDGDRHNAVSRAAANARRLQALTRDVLDTATIEAGELSCVLERVDLGAVIDDGVSDGRALLPSRVLSYDRPPSATWVMGDSQRLRQVLANLLDNADKSSPSDSPVEVAVDVSDGEATVSVTDAGPGLPSDGADRMFDKFVRGRGQTVHGTGLGLYICRQIVEAHGGRIWAESADGTGACVRFTIPIP